MRKTLILVAAVLTAGSLAACKPFWQKDETPAPTATAADPGTPVDTAATTPDPTVAVDPAKPVEPTATVATDKPATAEKTPATK